MLITQVYYERKMASDLTRQVYRMHLYLVMVLTGDWSDFDLGE